MIGAIKIKDGLFIGDELAAQVRNLNFRIWSLSLLTKSQELSTVQDVKYLIIGSQ